VAAPLFILSFVILVTEKYLLSCWECSAIRNKKLNVAFLVE
jgi:hypothetical protein